MMVGKSAEPKKLKIVTLPSRRDERASFPIVGICASAEGGAAIESFISGMPIDIDPGIAFVLVQHQAPDYKSILAELVQRFTRMQVFEAHEGCCSPRSLVDLLSVGERDRKNVCHSDNGASRRAQN